MAEQPSQGPQISVNGFTGLNLRAAKSQLQQGEVDRNFGCYPLNTGAFTRMPGKQLWRVFEDGTTPIPVYQNYQAFDGTGNIIIQNGDSISVFTLDELLNRAVQPDLTVVSTTSLAILGNNSTGAGGGPLGSTDNTFYPTTISVLSDTGSVISSSTTNSFTLIKGVYQISATVLVGMKAQAEFIAARAGLYNLTSGGFQTHYGSSVEILGTSVCGPKTGTSFQFSEAASIQGRFEVTEPLETFAIYMAGITNGGTTPWSSRTYAQGYTASGVTANNHIYSTINITRE